MRDVFAAWILCGLVGLAGLFLAQTADSHRWLPGAYAEVHIPGRGPIADAHLSIVDEFADATGGKDLADDLEDKEFARFATPQVPAPRHCWIDDLRRRFHVAG